MFEVVMCSAIMSIVLAAIFSGLISVERTMTTADLRIQTNDQARLAVDEIDRQVRSGNVLYNPATETVANSGVAPGWSLRIYTQANGNEQCVQWRVVNQTLQTRAWTVTWQVDGQVSGWQKVAYNIVNTTAPFSLDSSAAYGGRLVDIDLFANSSSSSASNVVNAEVRVAVTGRNTEYGYDQAVCNTVPSP
jgi:type II secretory pathway component PulJ